MEPPRASVVIPCYRHAGPLRRCLAGLVAEPARGLEIVVVDSASDPEVSRAAADFPGVQLVRSPERLRAAAARNLGAGVARGGVLLFLDADCVPEPGWTDAALGALLHGARVVGGPVLDALPRHPVAASDNLLQFADFLAERPEGPASYFPGCNLAMRRADFAALGGFPEPRTPTGEDGLLSQAALARWPEGLRFVRGMRVRHEGRTGLREFLEHQRVFGYCRAMLGIQLTPLQRRLGAHALVAPAIVAKRLGYVLGRVARYRPAGLPRALALGPLLVAGLVAWAAGFRRGLREAGRPA